jgi:hypothetical protein
MRYDANRAYELIPKNLLETVELVNTSYVCTCEKRHYMPRLTTVIVCTCGRTISFSRRMQIHLMKTDYTVKQQVKAILKKLQAK